MGLVSLAGAQPNFHTQGELSQLPAPPVHELWQPQGLLGPPQATIQLHQPHTDPLSANMKHTAGNTQFNVLV